MPVDASRLSSVLTFTDLPAAALDRIAAAANPVELPAGAVLTSQGDVGYTFFVIEDGTAEVTDGDVTLATLGPGDFFGEIGLLLTGRRTAAVTATSPIVLLSVFERDFRRICADVPEFERVLRAAMAERIRVGR